MFEKRNWLSFRFPLEESSLIDVGFLLELCHNLPTIEVNNISRIFLNIETIFCFVKYFS